MTKPSVQVFGRKVRSLGELSRVVTFLYETNLENCYCGGPLHTGQWHNQGERKAPSSDGALHTSIQGRLISDNVVLLMF